MEEQKQNEANVIETDYHTLFMDEKPQIFKQMHDEDNKPITGIYEESPSYKHFKLFFGDFMEPATGTHKIINELQKNEAHDFLEIFISSYGGEYNELVEFYNTINTNYGYVTTFLNYGYSAGALAFLFGTERIVYEHSEFMIHSYSTGVGGKREDLLNHVNFQDKQILTFFDKMLKPYFTKKEIKKINKGKDFWVNSKEMLERGIATGIIVEGVYMSREDYLNPPKKVKKSEKVKKPEKVKK